MAEHLPNSHEQKSRCGCWQSEGKNDILPKDLFCDLISSNVFEELDIISGFERETAYRRDGVTIWLDLQTISAVSCQCCYYFIAIAIATAFDTITIVTIAITIIITIATISITIAVAITITTGH